MQKWTKATGKQIGIHYLFFHEKRNAQIVLLRVCPLASDIDHLRPRADCTLSANAQSRTETHDGDDYALPKNPVQI